MLHISQLPSGIRGRLVGPEKDYITEPCLMATEPAGDRARVVQTGSVRAILGLPAAGRGYVPCRHKMSDGHSMEYVLAKVRSVLHPGFRAALQIQQAENVQEGGTCEPGRQDAP